MPYLAGVLRPPPCSAAAGADRRTMGKATAAQIHCLRAWLLLFLLLSNAVALARGCDLTTMSSFSGHVNKVCCADGACPSGSTVPTTCSKNCAPVFVQFFEECGAYFSGLPSAQAMEKFANVCKAADSKTTSCDVGSLLTTMFFSCSGIDHNEKTSFCGTECAKGVQDFLDRCNQNKGNDAAIYKQARKWVQQCAIGDRHASCHASDCSLDPQGSEPHCVKAKTRAQCYEQQIADNNIFCRWQHCKSHGPAPPPHHSEPVPGCTDSKAMNYDPRATVNANGACLYPEPPPPPPFVPKPVSIPCSAKDYFGCKTKTDCERVNRQWVSCEDLGHACECCFAHTTQPMPASTCTHCCLISCGCACVDAFQCRSGPQEAAGRCTLPCSNAMPQNCHTPARCLLAGKCQQPGSSPDQVAGCTNRTTSWDEPPPPPPGSPRQPPRCERSCSRHSMHTCREQAACESIGMQWDAGTIYLGQDGKVTRREAGRCRALCSVASPTDCLSQAACEAVDMQWVPSSCCGSGCGTPPPGEDAGSCRAKCSVTKPYNCLDQISCESVGKQWVKHVPGDGYGDRPAGCTAPWPTGHCQAACTEDEYFECKTKVDCEAIGLQWHEPQRHGTPPHTFLEAGRCSEKCSLLNPEQCDTKEQCEGIGYQWSHWHREFSGHPPPPAGYPGYCQETCASTNPQGCHSQKTCEEAGNQWKLDGVVEPGSNGGDASGQHRRLQVPAPPPAPPGVRFVGRCIDACTVANIGSCLSKEACEGASGRWIEQHLPPCPNFLPMGVPCSVPWDPQGTCEHSCSVAHPYDCQNEAQCQRIGGMWKSAAPSRPGLPAQKKCDVTHAPCDVQLFIAECATTNDQLELCDDTCGRFIARNYERCAAHPPQGMTQAQFKTHFGPIVSMCKSFQADHDQHACASRMQEATVTLTSLCCTDETQCRANDGSPTECSGACADAFVPFFAECGTLLAKVTGTSALGRFYQTCTANSKSQIGPDKKLCVANDHNAPFTAIQFRQGCEIWIKYVDTKTKTESSSYLQLVSVGKGYDAALGFEPMISIKQIMLVAK